MLNHFKALKITDKVYWVGAIDWMIRDFHGYSTNRGTTYNAYLVLADKITLIDTVKASHKDELFARLSSVIDLKDIQYVISNHSEMDHSGLLPEVIEIIKPEKVFTSKPGFKNLALHFKGIENYLTELKEGEEIDLGNMNIKTYETRLLHWPDSMFSYLKEEQILFSNDIFGSHLATGERFDYEIDSQILDYEAAKYYANIFMPYSQLALKLMTKIKEENLKIKYIATDHGPIWHKYTDKIIEKYTNWAQMKPAEKVVIAFDTMWGSTEKMAKAISEGVQSENVQVKVMPLGGSHRSDIATELLEAGAFIVGSPVINSNLYPTVADLLCYIKGLAPKNLLCSYFGSYGWSDKAIDELGKILTEDMKQVIAVDPVKIQYVPDAENLQKCYDMGVKLAKQLKKE